MIYNQTVTWTAFAILAMFVLEVCTSTQYARLDFVSVCPCLCLFLWLFVFVLEEYAPAQTFIVCVTFCISLFCEYVRLHSAQVVILVFVCVCLGIMCCHHSFFDLLN